METIVHNVNAEPVVGQIVFGLLINAFYTAQVLHHLQGQEPLDDQAKADLFMKIVSQWASLCDLREKAGQKQPPA